MKPILTIAIPTYNRLEYLKAATERIIKFWKRNPNIEFIISDNASTDGTEEYILTIQKKFPEIAYYKNETNLGFDGNFLNCFKKANGKYVWLVSDDDILLDGAIESILSALSYNPICVHLNSARLIQEHPFKYGKARLKEEGLRIYADKNEFLKKIGIFCTFISSLIFKTDLINKICNINQYANTNLIQSHALFEIMREKGVYIVNTQNCLAVRKNKSVSYDVFKTWVKNYSDLMLVTAVKCGFDKRMVEEELLKDLDTTIYKFIISFRKTCSNEKMWDRDCIWPYINRYPSLINKYKIAVNCPRFFLVLLQLIAKLEKYNPMYKHN